MSRVFANDPGDLGLIPGCIIPKTLKMELDTSLPNTQQYKVRINVKWSNSGKGVAPSPIPQCSSYWKGSLLVALDLRSPTLLFIAKRKREISIYRIYTHWYLKGSKNSEWGPVRKLLLYALEKFKIKFYVGESRSALLHYTIEEVHACNGPSCRVSEKPFLNLFSFRSFELLKCCLRPWQG